MRKMGRLFLVFVILATMLAGCTWSVLRIDSEGERYKTDEGGINIVTSIFPLYDFARAIVGEDANLTMLVKPMASIHSFDPSPADIKTINDADVFLYIGGESDEWINKILSSLDTSDKTVVSLMDHVRVLEEEEVEGTRSEGEEARAEDAEEPDYDEHIWTSPENAITMIRVIADVFCDRDARNADTYKQNAESYITEIQGIQKEVGEMVQNAKHNKIVVADRFPFLYFVEEFGLSYIAAFGACSDQNDADVATMARLIRELKQEEVPYVYHVELSTRNVAKSVEEQTGVKSLLLHSCHNVSKSEFEEGATYLSLMKQNVENLNKGLY